MQAELDADNFPDSPTSNTRTNDVAYLVINQNDLATAYTDLTGRFSFKSSSGNEYILVAYHFDGNRIIARASKNRKAGTIKNLTNNTQYVYISGSGSQYICHG